MTRTRPALLEARGIVRTFGSVVANAGIDLDVHAGEIVGVLGENGAGKSTLVRIIAGQLHPDAGTVAVDGQPLPPGDPAAALAAGIGLLHQEPLVLRRMTVLDDLLTASRTSGWRLRRRQARAELAATAERIGVTLRFDARVGSLSVGEQQQQELVRLLHAGVRVLILDEPTSAIAADQREQLFATLRRLAADGTAVVLVSHKLEEVLALCDRVVVLRHGQVSGERHQPLEVRDLVALMFDAEPPEVRLDPVPLGPPVLELRGLVAQDGTVTTEPVDLVVHAGEVVGLAGLEGSGQRGVLRAAAGIDPPHSGRVLLRGRDISALAAYQRVGLGLVYVPADRLGGGLVPGMTLTDHVLLASGARGLVDRRRARHRAAAVLEAARVRGRPDDTPERLSGGNQQRLMLGLMPEQAAVLLLEHPTRGLDLQAAAWVWQQLGERRRRGTAVVFSSADLEELLRVSDRVLVFYEGRVWAELRPADTDVDELGHLIGGSRAA